MPTTFSSPKRLQTTAVDGINTMQIIKGLSTLLLILVLLFNKTNAQSSERLRISLITCTPGQELYSIFGHSALRIIDSNSVSDFMINYGTFDFNDEDFYIKFMRGKLRYFVSIQNTADFMHDYELEGRGISEQILDFSDQEKAALKNALIENLKPENRFYQYDFFFDNCTTRLRDILLKNKSPQPVLPAVMPERTKFRQAIHDYLNQGGQHWSKLGIDILLGAKTDRIMSAKDQGFLPDNLMIALDQSNVKLVSSNRVLLPRKFNEIDPENKEPEYFTTRLLFLVFIFGLAKNKYAISATKAFDYLFFTAIGLLGILLVFMWVGTDHSMTKDNFNLAWALPTMIAIPWLMNKKNALANRFLKIHFYILGITLLSWTFIPQELNPALMPIALLLFIRILARIKK